MTETNRRPKQTERVMQYMRDYGSITQREAINDIGVYRLASRISELRKDGHAIHGDMIAVKNRYGETCHIKRYSLSCEGEKQ